MKNLLLFIVLLTSINLQAQNKKKKPINIGVCKADVLPTTTVKGVTITWGVRTSFDYESGSKYIKIFSEQTNGLSCYLVELALYRLKEKDIIKVLEFDLDGGMDLESNSDWCELSVKYKPRKP